MQIFCDSTERIFIQSKPCVLMDKKKEFTDKKKNHSVKMLTRNFLQFNRYLKRISHVNSTECLFIQSKPHVLMNKKKQDQKYRTTLLINGA